MWGPYIFARDQWHCRICGDRFQYSETVRKHIAHAHDENIPPSMYESSGAQFGSERKSHDLAAKTYRRARDRGFERPKFDDNAI